MRMLAREGFFPIAGHLWMWVVGWRQKDGGLGGWQECDVIENDLLHTWKMFNILYTYDLQIEKDNIFID